MNMIVREFPEIAVQDFLRASSFWTPQHCVPSAWVGHAPFAYWLVNVLKPRNIVELGVHCGFSFLVFCQAVKKMGSDCQCIGIDTWKGDEHAGFYEESVYDNLLVHRQPYASTSRLIRSTFDAAQPQFADGSIDLLHIDGRHRYEDVRSDFENWKPKLSKRAVVLFHDTNEASFGVSRFWNELAADYSHFEFKHAHGLGVLGVGSDLPVQLQQLFELTELGDLSNSVRDAYEQLGNAVINGQEVQRLTASINAYQTSTSWRLTAPLRLALRLMKSAASRLQPTLTPRPKRSAPVPALVLVGKDVRQVRC